MSGTYAYPILQIRNKVWVERYRFFTLHWKHEAIWPQLFLLQPPFYLSVLAFGVLARKIHLVLYW